MRLKPSGGERCLFLIHDGDGEVLLYRNLALQMPDDVAVYGVVPLAERGVPMIHTRVGAMADHYVREIRARQPHGPYYLSRSVRGRRDRVRGRAAADARGRARSACSR